MQQLPLPGREAQRQGPKGNAQVGAPAAVCNAGLGADRSFVWKSIRCIVVHVFPGLYYQKTLITYSYRFSAFTDQNLRLVHPRCHVVNSCYVPVKSWGCFVLVVEDNGRCCFFAQGFVR